MFLQRIEEIGFETRILGLDLSRTLEKFATLPSLPSLDSTSLAFETIVLFRL